MWERYRPTATRASVARRCTRMIATWRVGDWRRQPPGLASLIAEPVSQQHFEHRFEERPGCLPISPTGRSYGAGRRGRDTFDRRSAQPGPRYCSCTIGANRLAS